MILELNRNQYCWTKQELVNTSYRMFPGAYVRIILHNKCLSTVPGVYTFTNISEILFSIISRELDAQPTISDHSLPGICSRLLTLNQNL